MPAFPRAYFPHACFSRACAVLAAVVAIAAGVLVTIPASAETVTMPTGLKIIDTKVGSGAQPKKGQTVVVDYTGWLYENGAKGAKFDSSVDRGYPFMFKLGEGQVIQGWDDGVASMKVGGKRTLIIPPGLAYGSRGAGGLIPPNATLIFDVELLGLK